MQRLAGTDEVSALAELHERVVHEALADGRITVHEDELIRHSARALTLATYRQAARTRIGIRMIRGGHIDREIVGEIRDYQALVRQEEAAHAIEAEAA